MSYLTRALPDVRTLAHSHVSPFLRCCPVVARVIPADGLTPQNLPRHPAFWTGTLQCCLITGASFPQPRATFVPAGDWTGRRIGARGEGGVVRGRGGSGEHGRRYAFASVRRAGVVSRTGVGLFS